MELNLETIQRDAEVVLAKLPQIICDANELADLLLLFPPTMGAGTELKAIAGMLTAVSVVAADLPVVMTSVLKLTRDFQAALPQKSS